LPCGKRPWSRRLSTITDGIEAGTYGAVYEYRRFTTLRSLTKMMTGTREIPDVGDCEWFEKFILQKTFVRIIGQHKEELMLKTICFLYGIHKNSISQKSDNSPSLFKNSVWLSG
jgi:hypothetical protein